MIVRVIILLICVWMCVRWWCKVGCVQMLQKCLLCFCHHVCFLTPLGFSVHIYSLAPFSEEIVIPLPCLAQHSSRRRRRLAYRYYIYIYLSCWLLHCKGVMQSTKKRSSTQTNPPTAYIACILCLFFDTTVTVLPGLLVDPIVFLVYS